MNRRGLTLLEIVVILALIGLLLALILPAIQATREAANRASCANNLRQIGSAIHHYADVHSCWPPRLVFNDSGFWGQFVLLLPYLEMTDTYNAINFALNFNDRASITVTATSLERFLCVSDGRPSVPGAGFTSYHPCLGSGVIQGGLDAPLSTATRGDGVFATMPLSDSDIRDGLGHTAAMSEMVHAGSHAAHTNLSPPALGWMYYIHATPLTQREMIQRCEKAGPPIDSAHEVGRDWVVSRGYTHLFTPGRVSCFGFDGSVGDTDAPVTASSRHRQGVNVLFADGTVRFLENAIDEGVWRAIGSRDGREPLDPF